MQTNTKKEEVVGVLDVVNQRTQLVGQNRLELLLFKLNGKQIYGINVFKVKEVLQCPKLTLLPRRNPVVRGLAHIRGGTISVLDLSLATGGDQLENIDDSFVIITEYNCMIQGFLVKSVERIINTNWADIHPPPKGTGNDNYLTAVTEVDKNIVEIIDVEKVLSEIMPGQAYELDTAILDEEKKQAVEELEILVVDDSSVARKQVKRCLEKAGLKVTMMCDGKNAYEHLLELKNQGINVSEKYVVVISDIEMPEMDGYTLTASVRSDPEIQNLYIILHTSLSGVFNQNMIQKVGANLFLAKFAPEKLVAAVAERIKEVKGIDILKLDAMNDGE